MNRTGFEPDPRGDGGIEFWGQSFIAGTDGRILVQAPADREVVLVEEIDLAEIDAVRAGWPFFRDRRIDAYARSRSGSATTDAQAASVGDPRVGRPTGHSCPAEPPWARVLLMLLTGGGLISLER